MATLPKQIHLSTAILLMFAAGILIWANIIGTLHPKKDENGKVMYEYKSFGWPVPAVFYGYEARYPNDQREVTFGPSLDGVSRIKISVDAMTALSLLLSLWLICELWIRARSSQSSAHAPASSR